MPAHRLPDLPRRVAIPVPVQTRATPATATPLERFNAASAEEAAQTLLACLHSHAWAHRLTAHRPYPDLSALLAAADEASYDLSPADLTEALTAETLPALPEDTYAAAHTALSAAHAAYESRFGHVFVISLDGLSPEETLNHVLTAIRSRLANDPDEERLVTAEELRRLARTRLSNTL
ncbi:2-oxo-4-hydroxy-4-carboxy-5-ureidoimidazoline decarboxylase [Streptomyces sp. PU10]|uniref:2-oxo-4-hydroxy-4-carboxy-5-ureidoimidazoline decarboxylase n=1 Tax=unclassified Streptomyces TaxID=2593676 RepID=UPI001E3A8179|nr:MULTISPECIES: 2-oxo-4-hydroxy-4-carboxy-5-ureidoimidazoline decarboxylase [Streptomyces]MDU0255823.1 2-oxo-4-hydroxy-4-carboxy-5-ureidoimidazoline decarboxylase [Streptomyces sp. PU10]WSU06031.1 2-oxo-4-hydroxy-4-carboxy-5-ureidoimidazoline decarboxylase [Streptomyces sp. NBC_01124]